MKEYRSAPSRKSGVYFSGLKNINSNYIQPNQFSEVCENGLFFLTEDFDSVFTISSVGDGNSEIKKGTSILSVSEGRFFFFPIFEGLVHSNLDFDSLIVSTFTCTSYTI